MSPFFALKLFFLPLRLLFRLLRRLGAAAYRNQNLLLLLAAFLTVAVMAAVTGYWIFYRASYVLGALIPLCFAWARLHLRGLEVTVHRSQNRLQVGQEVEARIHLASSSSLTKLWLELEDCSDMPQVASRTILTIPAKGRRNWKVRMSCRRRGVYSVGPLKITTGDPFGLFRLSRTYGAAVPLMVLPQPQDLPYFTAPTALLPGEGSARRWTHYITPNASGIREYYPGDSYKRIHWPSTARLGRLAVKTFEMDPASNIWIVLDLDASAQSGFGDESTEEYGVRIAASLAWRFLGENAMIGLIASTAQGVVLDPARGTQQFGRILEALATVRADGQRPLARLLQEEARRFGRHTTVIVVTPSLDEKWVLALGALAQQGAQAAAVILEPNSFGAEDRGVLPRQALAAAGLPTYVVTQGADISLALGPAGLMDGATLWATAEAR